MNKVLTLTLKKEWFDLIKSGNKTSEYREHKKHWISRLIKNNRKVKFDKIKFINGYGSDKPYMIVEFRGLMISKGQNIYAKNGEAIDNDLEYFIILLGNILECG